MSEFLNKKKIPGILDYLESKIYERSSEHSYMKIESNETQLTKNQTKPVKSNLMNVYENMP